MALSEQALTQVETLRRWLSPAAEPERVGRWSDAALEALAERAAAAIAGWCDRTLVAEVTPRTLVLDGDGSRRLVLPDWPVVAIQAVTVDGEPVPPSTQPGGEGYVIHAAEGWLDRLGGCFPRGLGNVTVTARLGYDRRLRADDPRHRRALDDLEQACLLLCRHWFDAPAGTGKGRDALPVEVRVLLAPYRRLGV